MVNTIHYFLSLLSILILVAAAVAAWNKTVTGLLVGTVALISLVIVRFYYLPRKTK